VVAELESGRADLDQALALWERGEELYRACVAKLDSAQGRIEELGRRAEAARPATPEPADAVPPDAVRPDAA
jgi:exodeoxyribonuclease VII small subunit